MKIRPNKNETIPHLYTTKELNRKFLPKKVLSLQQTFTMLCPQLQIKSFTILNFIQILIELQIHKLQ